MTPVNDPPVAVDDIASILINAIATQINVLSNDTFAPDLNETLTITAVTVGSQGGTIERINSDTALRYRPATDFSGIETFTYTVSDGNGGTDTGTLTITVVEFRATHVSGKIFRDDNGNNTYDVGETALANLELKLDGTDSDGVAVHRTTRTSTGGDYMFADLNPGNYTVNQVASDVLVAGSNSTGIPIVADNEGGEKSSNNFTYGGLAPDFSLFASLASDTGTHVEFSSDSQGNTQWQTLSSLWNAFTNVTFSLSADSRRVTILATRANGQQVTDTVSTSERSLVRVMGQVHGTRLVRIVGAPSQFDLLPVATTTASATSTSALDAYFANLT